MKWIKCVALLWIMCITKSGAQSPEVVLVLPAANQIGVPSAGEIAVNFDLPVDPLSVNATTFRVFGRWSGPASGTFSFFDNDTEVRFLPNEPFFAGEVVLVQLSKGIQSVGGENLENPFAWMFWTETSPGFLSQPLVETIELRLPGEGHLQTYGAYAGDMNNDGFSDLVAVNESSDDLRILLNDGMGNYPAFSIFDTGDDSTPSPSEGADFNNDGEIDLVVTTAWDTEVRVLAGDGQGSFTNMDTYFTSNGVRGVVVGDFDGDGWDDMLTTNRLAGNISIFRNNGDGTFAISEMDLPGQDETACALADANGDGMLDVFFASFLSQKLGILLGDGDGNFTLSSEVDVQGQPWMIASADMNGDGNADVVSVNSNSNKTAIAFGDGAGGLSSPVHFAPPDHNFPLAVDLGDLDGDGDLEIVTSNYGSNTYTVFENDASGSFTSFETLNAAAAASCAILHDRDNDGDLDITGTDEIADVILLFENTDTVINNVLHNSVDAFELRVFPNPVSDRISFFYFLQEESTISISLINPLGEEIIGFEKKVISAGNHFDTWDVPGGISSGLYWISLRSGEKSETERILISRN